MRKQTRLPEPEALTARKQSGTESWISRRNQWRAARALGQKANAPEFNWPEWKGQSVYQHILPTLRQQTDAHCSFCDGYPVPVLSVETIEHFYPKTMVEHEHRVMDWENLFYACTACQASKNSLFHPGLLKPDEVEYSFSRYFYFDFEEGKIYPLAAEGSPEFEHADATIKHYGLNDRGRPRHRVQARREYILSGKTELDLRPYRDFLCAGGGEG